MKQWTNAIREPRRPRRPWTTDVSEPRRFESRVSLFKTLRQIEAERLAAEVRHVIRLNDQARDEYIAAVSQGRGERSAQRIKRALKKRLAEKRRERV